MTYRKKLFILKKDNKNENTKVYNKYDNLFDIIEITSNDLMNYLIDAIHKQLSM